MTTLFISDLHLSEQTPKITANFINFLQKYAYSADALYILGDFFNAYIGDDDLSTFKLSIIKELHKLTTYNTKLFIMHGNRDFLLGEQFCRLANANLLKDPSTITLNNKNIIITHGDGLCTDDKQYQTYRKLIRNPITKFILRKTSLEFRQKQAYKLRNKSQTETKNKPTYMMDVNNQAVTKLCQKYNTNLIIHGHTHKLNIHNDNGIKRYVLGDWDDFNFNALSFKAGEFSFIKEKI